jgi:hypothetical protein
MFRRMARRERPTLMTRMCRGPLGIHVKRPKTRTAKAVGTYAIGSFALGAIATGAIAVGTLAVGRLAIGRLAVREGRIKRLRIDELEIGQYRILQQEPQAGAPNNGRAAAERVPALGS